MFRRAVCVTVLLFSHFFITIAAGQTAAILPFANRTARSAAAVDRFNPSPGVKPPPNPAEAQDQAPAVSNLDWIGESIAETLRDSMAARGVLTVAREDTDAAYRQLSLHPRATLTAASVIKVGEALDAEHVVYGSFEWKANAGGGARAGTPDDCRPLLRPAAAARRSRICRDRQLR